MKIVIFCLIYFFWIEIVNAQTTPNHWVPIGYIEGKLSKAHDSVTGKFTLPIKSMKTVGNSIYLEYVYTEDIRKVTVAERYNDRFTKIMDFGIHVNLKYHTKTEFDKGVYLKRVNDSTIDLLIANYDSSIIRFVDRYHGCKFEDPYFVFAKLQIINTKYYVLDSLHIVVDSAAFTWDGNVKYSKYWKKYSITRLYKTFDYREYLIVNLFDKKKKVPYFMYSLDGCNWNLCNMKVEKFVYNFDNVIYRLRCLQ